METGKSPSAKPVLRTYYTTAPPTLRKRQSVQVTLLDAERLPVLKNLSLGAVNMSLKPVSEPPKKLDDLACIILNGAC